MVFFLHTTNNIYGTSLNPHDNKRSCAGSSGGEGGLIASNCVPISIGTDIGGSIRGPSAFCGVIGFKPTPYRTSYKGLVLPMPDGNCP
jgi:amidase